MSQNLLSRITPHLTTNTYSIVLPSGLKIEYRPFLVREQKKFLIAKEQDDPEVMSRTVKEILQDCTLTPGVEVDSLAAFDLEFFFLQIRIRSVGETASVLFSLKGCKETCKPIPVDIDLRTIEIKRDPKHSRNVKLSDTLGLVMRYPTYGTVQSLNVGEDGLLNATQRFNLVVKCIESITAGEDTIPASDVSEADIAEFLESLTQDQFVPIQAFFDTIPRVVKTLDVKCPSCGNSETVTVEGMRSFFS